MYRNTCTNVRYRVGELLVSVGLVMCSSEMENEIVPSLCADLSAPECVHMHLSSIVKGAKLKCDHNNLNECLNGSWSAAQ